MATRQETLTITVDGARYTGAFTVTDTSSVKREYRDSIATDPLFCGDGRYAEQATHGGGTRQVEQTDLDRAYRDHPRVTVDGNLSSTDYVLDLCVAICRTCNQHGVKRDDTLAKYTRWLAGTVLDIVPDPVPFDSENPAAWMPQPTTV